MSVPLIQCYECGREISSLASACPSCGAPKEINAASIVGSSVKLAPDSNKFFHVARNGRKIGLYTKDGIEQCISDGYVRRDDLCWQPGMDGWIPAWQLLGIVPKSFRRGQRVRNKSNLVAGIFGLFLGPVGLWYKGHWAAGFAWLVVGGLTIVITGGFGLVFAPVFWIGMMIHAIIAEPRSS